MLHQFRERWGGDGVGVGSKGDGGEEHTATWGTLSPTGLECAVGNETGHLIINGCDIITL